MTYSVLRLLPGALLLLSASRASAAPTPTVTPEEAQCFQAQFLLRLPGLEGRQFIQAVASLRDAPDSAGQSQAAIAQRVAQLRQEADALRHNEAAAYSLLTPLLVEMGAPPSLRTWIASEQGKLSQPVILSKGDKKAALTDPDTADVLATMDETSALKADTDDHLSTVGEWVSLTYRTRGLWAADVGELTAALQVAVANGRSPRLAASLARHLRDASPAHTPPPVLDALSLLIPASGNLSGLIPTATPIPLTAATEAHQALLSAFFAPSLAALTPTAAPKPPSPQP